MKNTTKPVVATILTLGDSLESADMIGDIEIVNECNETLITVAYADENVCSLKKTLAKELLDRTILAYGTRDGRTLIKLEGVEDAD